MGNILLLCGFKYFNHVIEILKTSFNFPINTLEILVPLGISFFTIQQISYLIDSYKNKIKQQNIIHYSLFICFFPQFLAGPIVRHQEIIPQFLNPKNHTINQENVFKGLFLITIGMLKKVLVADNLVDFINCVNNHQMFDAGLLSWGYAFAKVAQGYFDFSGYCDMALGIAMLFNIKLPINFDSPYKSLDISDYWRRWHITMGRFLKYHVYIPMGGSRCSKTRHYFNLFFVFLVTGIWHGANWPCVFYGVINGMLVCLNKLWKNTKIELNKNLAVLITFITMVFIAPLMIIKHIHQYFLSVKSMVGLNGFHIQFFNQNHNFNFILLLLSLIIVFCFKNSNELAPKYLNSKKISITFLLVIIFIISTLSITKGSEFIYFNF